MITMQCFIVPGGPSGFSHDELLGIVTNLTSYYKPHFSDFAITMDTASRIIISGKSASVLAEALAMRTGWRKVEA